VKARCLPEATGAVLLLLLPYFCPLVLPLDLALYHHRLPLTNIVRGLLLDMLGALILGGVLIAAISRLSPFPRRIAASCLAGLVFWRSVTVSLILIGLWHSNLASPDVPSNSDFYRVAAQFWFQRVHSLAAEILLLLAALAWLKPAVSRLVVQAARLGLAAFGFSAIWVAPQLFYLAFVPHARAALAPAPVQPQKGSGQRIVWILFDELSYDLVFDHRPAGLAVPNLEKLHSTSVSFGNLEPVGLYTERVIPSLLAGQSIDKIGSALDGSLSYMDQAQHRWLTYDPNKTLFGLAQANGWNPGVSGWYNPYCRIFASVLTSCSWEPGIPVELPLENEGASEDKSSLANALVLPHKLLTRFSRHANTAREELLDRNIKDYLSVMKRGSALIQNDQVHFVFLHLPVPHPPGFYNRNTHKLSESGDYFDNLVLADDTLGELMQGVDHTPWASQTTVIVSSDHSWRTQLWRLSPDWTDEEEHISRGRFDPRPVLLIHFPGQRSSSEVLTPLSEFTEHDIIAAMLRREMRNPENLNAFLLSAAQQRGHSDPPPPPPLQ
jgi:type I phosphodiesterase/nucleotide pyrophosphatase